MQSSDIIVGIDFGTTNSLIAYHDGTKCIVIHNEQNDPLLESKVTFTATNHIVGQSSLLTHDMIEIRSVKRMFGQTFEQLMGSSYGYIDKKILIKDNGVAKLKIFEKLFSAVDIGSLIFTKLRTMAEMHLMQPVARAVVTVPVYFNEVAKSEIRSAAKIAGITITKIITEPVAAGYAYNLTQQNGHYLVFDLGGGTLDISVLRLYNGVMQVIATGGDINLGGDDIDVLIMQYLLKKHKILDNQYSVLSMANALKHQLSQQQYANICGYSLNEQELSIILKSFIDKIIIIASDTYISAQEPKLDGIILSGGATILPIIQHATKNRFNTDLYHYIDPKHVVVHGAAMHATNFMPQPKKYGLIIDALPLSIGVGMMGNIVEKLIYRNTPVPARASQIFTAQAINQTSIIFRIVQGERELIDDCITLTELTFPLLRNKAGVVKVMLTLIVDDNYKLTIKIQEQDTNNYLILHMDYNNHLSPQEIQNTITASMIYAEKDHIARRLIEVTQTAEMLISNAETVVSTLSIESSDINNSIITLRKAIAAQNYDDIISYSSNLEALCRPLIESDFVKQIEEQLIGKKI